MPEAGLPPHVQQTVHAVEKLHVEHREGATAGDRLLDFVKATISRPSFLALLFVIAVGWIMANLLLPERLRPDPFPFVYLTLVLSLGALCLTVLILSTQWRADRLAEHREKLILQLTFVSEQKTAKLIALLEELRRDLPHVRDRVDTEAQQMTETVNVTAVAEALRPDTTLDKRPVL
ncbi:MAG: DUF1003 domain-containing protein [Alphaproteobacteria bacterium]|nr:DUF1003 domain-containing protein [Alphaproteobacteria bacterium]